MPPSAVASFEDPRYLYSFHALENFQALDSMKDKSPPPVMRATGHQPKE